MNLKTSHRIVRDLNGVPMCINDLPGQNVYWTADQKARVLIAIDGSIITERDARLRYALSEEELASWREAFKSLGLTGLRALHRRIAP